MEVTKNANDEQLTPSQYDSATISIEEDMADEIDTKMISIRLNHGLIKDLKAIAIIENTKYQKLIKKALQEFVKSEFKNIVVGMINNKKPKSNDN